MNDQFIGNIISIIVVVALVLFAIITSIYHRQKKTNASNTANTVKICEIKEDHNIYVDNQNIIEETENLIDDKELMAVITAAIYASIGESFIAPKDGLIVRSIRRVSARR